MLKIDAHTHPNLLKVPHQGDEFVARAIELGFDAIVFTDHMPFTVTGDEHDRIPFGRVADYCEAVAEIRERYRDSIRVLTGIEIDHHPSCVKEEREVLSCGSFDLVLGSSHLNIAGFNVPFGSITETEYAELVIENYISAAESSLFDVMTHLDVYRWVFSEACYPTTPDGFTPRRVEALLRRLFSIMEQKSIALEINAAPLFKGFDTLGAYPESEILKIAADYSLRYSYGSDAHAAHHVGYGYDELRPRFECAPLL